MSLECATEMAWGAGRGPREPDQTDIPQMRKPKPKSRTSLERPVSPLLRSLMVSKRVWLGTPAGKLHSSGVKIQTPRDAGTFGVSFPEQFPRACPTAICCTHWKGPTCDKLEYRLSMLHRQNFTPEFFHKVQHLGPRPYYLRGT